MCAGPPCVMPLSTMNSFILVGRERNSVGPHEVVGDDAALSRVRVDAVHGDRHLELRFVALVVAEDAVARSVNQIAPSAATATSFGAFKRFPLKRSMRTVMMPLVSVRVNAPGTVLASDEASLAIARIAVRVIDGARKMLTCSSSSIQRMIRLFGMSLHKR